MPFCIDTRLVVQSLLVGASILAVYGFTPAENEANPRVQPRLYSHLEYADSCVDRGSDNEAAAYAEMVLLKREITVYVDDSGAPWQIREQARQAVRDAAVNWEDALKREIKFRFVPFRDADVLVSFTDGVKHGGKEAAGLVRWTRQVMNLGSGQYHYEVRANITLRASAPSGALMNYKQMLHTAGHELGHVLGLEDSAKQGDLMGPLVLNRPTERATKAERDSLIALRSQAGDILARINNDEPLGQEPNYDMVVFGHSEEIEATKPTVRDDRDERRAALVRSARRNEQAQPRKKGFTFTGLAHR